MWRKCHLITVHPLLSSYCAICSQVTGNSSVVCSGNSWSWCCNGSFTAKRWWQRWRGSIKQPFSTTSSLVEHISLFYFWWIPELHFYSWFLIRRNSNIMFNGIPTSCPTWFVCNEVFNLGALLSAPPPASTPIRTSSATPPSAKAVGSRPLPALPKVSAPGFRYQGQGCNGILCHDICLY